MNSDLLPWSQKNSGMTSAMKEKEEITSGMVIVLIVPKVSYV